MQRGGSCNENETFSVAETLAWLRTSSIHNQTRIPASCAPGRHWIQRRELFFVPVYSWSRPKLPTTDVLTVVKVLPRVFGGQCWAAPLQAFRATCISRIFQLQISSIPQTSGILGCASWWGGDALDLQAPPAESCLKLSQFENSILEADKNSARFHTVPVEAGGTDGSLQAA